MNKNEIRVNDIMFATVIQRGNVIFDGRISGMASMADVMRMMRRVVGEVAGLLILRLRNLSQGWVSSTAFRIARPEGEQLQFAF